ncbi:hypothetical protein LPY66_05785 [Dehalobacter sp. DCM]|uniref:hypothetical protein n=1 Tax=Dehalobacter sp. DCM TaxID=2907827 RepID=UPI0030818C33|nr:hypothetical protein LPY66_05785 [Dehalobacter sp. DCM]
MVQEHILTLIGIYTEDCLDYQELLKKMQSFRSFLDSSEQPSQWNDELEQKMSVFCADRDAFFIKFRERAELAKHIQNMIWADMNSAAAPETHAFDIRQLQPYVNQAVYDHLLAASQELRKYRQEVLELDSIIIPRLEIALESIKLELHRMLNTQTTRNLYQQKGTIEARFIDKLK